MKLRLFTLVWGEPYLSWFENALVASLAWERNRAALGAWASEWNIYCREGEIPRLRAIAEPLGVPLQFHPFEPKNSSGETLQPCLLDHMRNCLQDGSAMLVAPPDTIFGEGTIASLCTFGSLHGVCVAVPHIRVNAGAWGKPDHAWRAPELVDFAFANLHPTWRDADAGLAHSNSYLGGVSWRALAPGLFAVQHRLPTCYLANIDASDVAWFAQQWETGTWDHTWPVKLVKEQRQRTLAGSDAAMILELTRENENIPALAPANAAIPDAFWRDLEHNFVNRNVISVFRGANHG